jgi:hypothetical protein
VDARAQLAPADALGIEVYLVLVKIHFNDLADMGTAIA